MDDAQEFQDCHTMMNLGEEEEEFLRNIVQRPDGQYSSTDLDPVWSEIMPSCHQRDETENNGTTNSSDNVVSPRAYVLSFDCSAVNPNITKLEEENDTLKRSSPIKRSRAAGQNVEGRKNKSRCSEEVEDHIMAERRRRQRISEKFIALSATIPGLKKLDKVTILDEAIKYVKQLQDRVSVLEKDKSLASIKRIEFYENDDNFYEVNEALPKIEVRVSENQMFMGIYCEKQKGTEFKILTLLENFHLCVTSSSVLPFGKSILGITIIAQVGEEYNTPVNEVVKNLRQILLCHHEVDPY
ncbi:hypothetical protein K1719_044514 [Acacia pycnantha]|nr:hypothetical protein K1719_044514 [Acacia pycnantha]